MPAFQGREADIVVMSLVRDRRPPGSEEQPWLGLGYLTGPDLINVLLYPPRQLLVLVGDFEHFASFRVRGGPSGGMDTSLVRSRAQGKAARQASLLAASKVQIFDLDFQHGAACRADLWRRCVSARLAQGHVLAAVDGRRHQLVSPGDATEEQQPTDPIRQVTTMRSTRWISRFVTAFVGAAFQVIVLGGTGHRAHEVGVVRRRHTVRTRQHCRGLVAPLVTVSVRAYGHGRARADRRHSDRLR